MTPDLFETPAARLTRSLDACFDDVPEDWREVTEAFRRATVGRSLIGQVDARVAAGATVFPPEPLRALQLTRLDQVHTVILGQDPYHGAGQAEGLAFSVAEGQKLPPSLRNIFKEIQRDLGQPIPAHGSLRRWAEQGVLLLNTSLTVEEGLAASHAGWGWEALTASLLAEVLRTPGRVLMLWGAHAQKQVQGLDLTPHLVLQANHPSPLSATRGPVPFIGCGHFGRSLPHIRTLRPDFAW